MDTIKKVANAILDAGEGCQSGLVYVDPVEAAKAAIAVLSAEECSYNAGFNDGWEAANGEPPEAALSTDAEPVKTVPAVAVKALRWKGPDSYGEYHSLDGLWGYIIRCEDDGHWLTEVGDYFRSPEAAQAAAQADYEARVRSALSAQVQDVAVPDGWQLVPKEPTEEMLFDAWDRAAMANPDRDFYTSVYQDMLTASPAAKLEEKP